MNNCKKCEHFPVCMWNGQKQDDCGFYKEERPQGEWEFFSVGNIQYSRCSICKDEHISEYTDLDWWYDNFKYCPNCGAKMTKEAENE